MRRAIVVFGVLIAACGGNVPANTGDTNGVAIGAAGGTVTSSSGGASVAVPAGALSTTTRISVVAATNPPSTPLLLPTTTYDFGPSGTQFASPVTVRIPYTVSAGVVQSKLRLYTYLDGTWQQVAGSYVDSATHTVVGMTSHFTLYTTCQFPCYPDAQRVDVALGPFAIPVFAGSVSESQPVDVYTNNITGAPSLTLSGAPAGVSMTTQYKGYIPDGLYMYNVTFSVPSSVPAGTYVVNVVGHAAGAADAMSAARLVVQAPSYGMTLTPTGINVGVGTPGSGTVTIARNGVNGAITLSTVGLPAGVTSQFSPAVLGPAQSTSTLTLSATSAAVVGSSSFKIHGVSAGVTDVDASASVTVIPPGGFALAGTPPLVAVGQGTSASTGIKTTRAPGFTGTVAYAVTSTQPAGMTATLAATTVADSVRLTITTTAAVGAGTYTVVVTGTSGGVSNPVNITVTVGTAGATTVSLDLSNCTARNTTVWMAYQDGSGPFTQVTPTNGVYSFPMASGKGVLAVGLFDGTAHGMNVSYGTPTELGLLSLCRNPQQPTGSKSLTFTASGLPAGDQAALTVGGLRLGLESNVTDRVDTFIEGALDLFGLRFRTADPSQDVRGYLSRDRTLAAGSTTTIDFSDASTFAPLTTTMTGPGFPALELYTGPSCSLGNTFMPVVSGQTFTPGGLYYGLPTSLLRSNDMYRFSVGSFSQHASTYFHTFGPQALTVGAAISTPSLATLGGPYRRLQATVALPSDYTEAQFSYGASAQFVNVIGHPSYFGGNSLVLAMPDLTGVAGFDPAWLPASGSTGGYSLTARTAPYERCVDGSVYKEAIVTGS